MSQRSGLDALCVIENLVRTNYYSSTYRSLLRVGNELEEWDIMRISLPFPPQKEKELMVRFGITQDQLEDYYTLFGRCIKNDINVTNFLTDAEVKSVVRYVSYVIEKKEGERGSDIYLITRPMESFANYLHLNPGDTITLLDLLNFAARMLQITKGMSTVGTHYGCIDIDSIYVMPEGEKQMVTLGGFMFASRDAEDEYLEIPAATPPHIHPKVLAGEAPTLATDLYSVFNLLWTLTNGDHYTAAANLEEAPKYAPPELVALMASGMQAAEPGTEESQDIDKTVRTLNKGLHALIKRLKSDESLNTSFEIQEPPYDLSTASLIKVSKPIPINPIDEIGTETKATVIAEPEDEDDEGVLEIEELDGELVEFDFVEEPGISEIEQAAITSAMESPNNASSEVLAEVEKAFPDGGDADTSDKTVIFKKIDDAESSPSNPSNGKKKGFFSRKK